MRLLERLVRHEHWMRAIVCLDTPEQLRLPEQLQAEGHYRSMYMPLLDDTTVLFLPHITLKRNSICAPIKAALDGMPCLSKECEVAVDHDGGSCHIDLMLPLVFSYSGGAHQMKLLATHDGTDCELHLAGTTGMCSGVKRLGAFLLVHGIYAEHPEVEMEAEAEQIQGRIEQVLEMAAEDGADDGALVSLQEDLVLQMYVDVEAAGARAASRLDWCCAWQLPSMLSQLLGASRQHTCPGSLERRYCGTPTQSWAGTGCS
jgi:hypothetical protein